MSGQKSKTSRMVIEVMHLNALAAELEKLITKGDSDLAIKYVLRILNQCEKVYDINDERVRRG